MAKFSNYISDIPSKAAAKVINVGETTGDELCSTWRILTHWLSLLFNHKEQQQWQTLVAGIHCMHQSTILANHVDVVNLICDSNGPDTYTYQQPLMQAFTKFLRTRNLREWRLSLSQGDRINYAQKSSELCSKPSRLCSWI